MIICVAQTSAFKGDIARNIEHHTQFINTAVSQQVDLIIFPELSITGYEPTLAQELATTQEDPRFDVFQTMSDAGNISIAIGAPTSSDAGLCISMILFQPNQPRLTYSKKYIHADEEPFFVSGQNFPTLFMNGVTIAPAICYEISIKAHAETANQHGAKIYLASVAKTAKGVEQAHNRLAQIAKQYAIPVLMANSIGPSDNFVGAGNTAVWDGQSNLIAKLDNRREGMIIYNYNTQKATLRWVV